MLLNLCKTFYLKEKNNKAWNQGTAENWKWKTKYLSETNKVSYYNQSKWLEKNGISGLYYRKTLGDTYKITLDNASDTSKVEDGKQ